MPFAAFDLHKREIEAAVFDDDGRITLCQRFPGTREAILAFARRHLTKLHQVAMEATFNTWAVADLLEPLAGPITKQDNSHTRWMLIDAAQSADDHPGPALPKIPYIAASPASPIPQFPHFPSLSS